MVPLILETPFLLIRIARFGCEGVRFRQADPACKGFGS